MKEHLRNNVCRIFSITLVFLEIKTFKKIRTVNRDELFCKHLKLLYINTNKVKKKDYHHFVLQNFKKLIQINEVSILQNLFK